MDGNGLNGRIWLEIAETDWKWLEIAENDWKWLEMAKMAGYCWK